MNSRHRRHPPPTDKKTKVDRLRGKKIHVGACSLTAIKQIGEGGSAFIYLARQDATASPLCSATNLSNTWHADNTSIASEPGGGGDMDRSTRSLSLSSVAMSDYGDADDCASVGPTPRRSRRSLLTMMGRSSVGSGSSSSQRGQQQQERQHSYVVLKATSVAGSSTRRRQAEAEVRMLRRFVGHPNIVRLLDAGFGDVSNASHAPSRRGAEGRLHFTVLEHCPYGSLMDLIARQRRKLLGGSRKSGQSWDEEGMDALSTEGGLFQKLSNFRPKLSGRAGGETGTDTMSTTLVTDDEGFLDTQDILEIFKQIASTVDFLHSQFGIDEESSTSILQQTRTRLPVIHRDIKPENVLIAREGPGRWHVKLCDFGSAIEGTVPLRNPAERLAAQEQIRRSTTQMYRAPEMVDLHSVNELTEKTDVWALGCSLYTTCFLQNCFEESSSLAILAGKFIVPRRHPYDDQILELIRRMLLVDASQRADMVEVCSCIDALQEGLALPPRPSPSCGLASKCLALENDVDNTSRTLQTSKEKVSNRTSATPTVVGGRQPKVSNRKSAAPMVGSRRASKSSRKSVYTNELNSNATSGGSQAESPYTEQKSTKKIDASSAVGRRSLRAKHLRADKSNAKHMPSFDHIYGDLEADSSWLRDSSSSPVEVDTKCPSRNKHRDSRAKSTRCRGDSSPVNVAADSRERMLPGRLFGPDEEWREFERASRDDALDRVKVFPSEERCQRHSSACTDSCSLDETPPLMELSSVTTASSEDLCVVVRDAVSSRQRSKVLRSQFRL